MLMFGIHLLGIPFLLSEIKEMVVNMNFKEIMMHVKTSSPLVHNITNYVTVNDCANILLAAGASPIMADDIDEVEEITSICHGLNINIGTLNQRTIESMLLAGKKANAMNHPVTLDPVGTGASTLRTETANKLLKNIDFTVIKGNVSEIKTLLCGYGNTKGVDANEEDVIHADNLHEVISTAKKLASNTKSIVVITGPVDIVTDGSTTYMIKNGHAMMSKITGTGCMLSCLITAYISANESILEATATAVMMMGLAGELAFSKGIGNMTYRNRLIDEIYKMTPETLERGANYEII